MFSPEDGGNLRKITIDRHKIILRDEEEYFR